MRQSAIAMLGGMAGALARLSSDGARLRSYYDPRVLYCASSGRDGGNGMSGCGDDGLCDWRAPEEGDTELECERCGRKLARRIIHPDEQTAILVWAEHFKGGAERFAEFFAPVELLRERVRERARRRLQAVREQPDHTENIRGNGEKN